MAVDRIAAGAPIECSRCSKMSKLARPGRVQLLAPTFRYSASDERARLEVASTGVLLGVARPRARSRIWPGRLAGRARVVAVVKANLRFGRQRCFCRSTYDTD